MSKSSLSTIHYSIAIEDAVAHLFRVRLKCQTDLDTVSLRLPNWIPGSYMIRDFSKHIVSLKRLDSNKAVSQIDKSTWQVEAIDRQFEIEYLVYAWDLSVRGAHLDQFHGFFNGTSVFLEVVELHSEPCTLLIEAPRFNGSADWRVSTSLRRDSANDDPRGFGQYQCDDYDELIDHPVEMGDLKTVEFSVKGVPHEISTIGYHEGDLERIAKDLKAVCEYQIALFGELPSCVERYVFLVHVLDNGYGGLEHRSSTALHCSRKELPVKGDESVSDDYLNFLTLCSHEYFHTWNIKQIKPAAFTPYALQAESYTQQLWIFEGFTSYFEDYCLLQAGVITEEQYLGLLSQVITRVQRGKGQLTQSVTESSFNAWTKFYQQDQNAPNAVVSYYQKGKLIALCIDLLLRQQTANALTLEHVMKQLWLTFGKPNRGLQENEFEQWLEHTFDVNMKTFIEQHVYRTEALPIETLLQASGVELTWTAPASYHPLNTDRTDVSVNLGATVKNHALGAEVISVYHDSNAHSLALSTGDIIIAVNDYKVDAQTIEKKFASFKPEQSVTVHYFRRDRLLSTKAQLKAAEKNAATLTRKKDGEPFIKWPLIER